MAEVAKGEGLEGVLEVPEGHALEHHQLPAKAEVHSLLSVC